MIKRYRKKPVEVEAVSLSDANYEDIVKWITDNGGKGAIVGTCIKSTPQAEKSTNDIEKYACIVITTLEGNMIANGDDYIIKGVAGEFYPCKKSIFEASYEAVE